MRATEVLKRYADGKRDFSGANLRGQSFKGKDLSGANFSEADIRGANFTNAKLIGANFKRSKAGLQRCWTISLAILPLILSLLSGFTSGMLGIVSAIFLNPGLTKEFATITRMSASNEAAIIASIIVVSAIVASFFVISQRYQFVKALWLIGVAVIATSISSVFGSQAIYVTISVFLVISLTLLTSLEGATSVCILALLFGNRYGAISFIVPALSISLPSAGFGTIGLTVASKYPVTATWVIVITCLLAMAVSIGSVVFYISIALRAIAGDEGLLWLREFALAITATGGTSFRNADLTDADFTSATLKSTDFRKANLTRTQWYQAKKLDRVRPGTTYLQIAKIRQLLLTGQGQAQNFNRQNLRGINLQGANLADASFISADLSSAKLQDADLSRAKLVQTQLDEADLTGATLTGAYIEDWGITSHTKLQGVRCEYVFMREPTKEDPNPHRKPDNWKETFKDGDFADFIKPIVDTLDLYHNQDVDPRAIAISFKQLAENHPDAELEIVAMEKRGGDKFLLRVATAPDANHSELNAEYFVTYNEIKALAEREIKALIEEKDSRISSLENMIATALQRPSFYAETYQHQGDIMTDSSKINVSAGGSVGAVGGGNISNQGVMNLGTISGNVTNAINQLPDSSEPEKPGIKELLSQLQAAINDPNLADDDKTQALEQIKVLAEAGKNLNSETAQKQAKRAIGFLKVIAEGLPSAAQLVKTCQDILPAIAHYFGL